MSGNTVSFIGAGTCSLYASAAATSNYLAANGSVQSFTVTPTSTPTITIGNIPSDAVYNGSGGFTATYNYSGNSSATKSVISRTQSICTTSGSAVTYVKNGTWRVATVPVTCSSPDEGAPGPSLLGTGDIDTMQTITSTQMLYTSMTEPHVCLLSAASTHPSISFGKERDAESGNDYFPARHTKKMPFPGPAHFAYFICPEVGANLEQEKNTDRQRTGHAQSA